MKKTRSSKKMFDRILMGYRLEQTPTEVRRALRSWAYSVWLPERERPKLSDDQARIVEQHLDFEEYIDQEMQEFMWDNQSLGQIMLSITWDESHYNKPLTFVDALPWFLKFSPTELSTNAPKPYSLNQTDLRTEKTVHTPRKMTGDTLRLTVSGQ